ncbi:MAG: hypothetical protein ACOC55_02490 [Candidatus Natronoplasma sp.]
MWSRGNLAILVVVILVISSIGIYYWYGRDDHWTMKEVKNEIESNESDQFDSSRAGETITIKGEVTNISSNTTEQGVLFAVELDEVSYVKLLYWDEVPYEIGETITEEIEIDEFSYNDENLISSKRIGLHPIIKSQATRVVNEASNEMSGLHFDVSEREDGTIKVEIIKDEEVTLELDNSSAELYQGCDTPDEDHSALGDYSMLEDNEKIDEIEELSIANSQNDVITFHDTNENGSLDTGDYFLVENLEKPDGDPKADIYTYHLTLHNEEVGGPSGSDSPWTSYLIYNSEGLYHFDPPH